MSSTFATHWADTGVPSAVQPTSRNEGTAVLSTVTKSCSGCNCFRHNSWSTAHSRPSACTDHESGSCSVRSNESANCAEFDVSSIVHQEKKSGSEGRLLSSSSVFTVSMAFKSTDFCVLTSARKARPVGDVRGAPTHTLSSRWPWVVASPQPAVVAFDDPMSAATHSSFSNTSALACKVRCSASSGASARTRSTCEASSTGAITAPTRSRPTTAVTLRAVFGWPVSSDRTEVNAVVLVAASQKGDSTDARSGFFDVRHTAL